MIDRPERGNRNGVDSFVWAGRVVELKRHLADAPDEFVARCTRRYAAAGYGDVGFSEAQSWRNSWPALVELCERAGLADWTIYLEYGTPGGSSRFDALLLSSAPDGRSVLTIVELKQWTDTTVLSDLRVLRSDGVEAVHPVNQVKAYLAFIENWSPSADLRCRGVVLLHNAEAKETASLSGGQTEIPVLGKAALQADVPEEALRKRLGLSGHRPPHERQVSAMTDIVWRPGRKMLDSLSSVLEKNSAFILIGDQQEALLKINAAIDRALRSGQKAVIAVGGGPGSGKTVIATRVLAHLAGRADVSPLYLSASGTLRKQMQQAAAGVEGARDLFRGTDTALSPGGASRRVVLLDEGQRLIWRPPGSGPLNHIIGRSQAVVVFLDERQVIRPKEGVTVEEIGDHARHQRAEFEMISLSGCFRCGGSRAYGGWINDLLYETPSPWIGADYDLGASRDPRQLQSWIDSHVDRGSPSRIAAGFCWPWGEARDPLPEDVAIEWDDDAGVRHGWSAPWNARRATAEAPVSQFWATGRNGHRQIGCVYTAQGLEYDYGGVIMGGDLVRRGDRWEARPGKSHDKDLMHLDRDRYLPLALNIYRILLTRGMKGTRIYSTDPETQTFLADLIPANGG
ncbi:DNA/RNA helicase domain-containing protein [Actinocorallia herbida]|nr:DNA/RNA helicase domain-containing protein [Actinocorallia herbida]